MRKTVSESTLTKTDQGRMINLIPHGDPSAARNRGPLLGGLTVKMSTTLLKMKMLPSIPGEVAKIYIVHVRSYRDILAVHIVHMLLHSWTKKKRMAPGELTTKM
jgi:hypothetical protein